MKIDTLFFKFLVFFSILLVMALVRKNIKELFATTQVSQNDLKLLVSIHDNDKTNDSYNVTLNWTMDSELEVEYYIFSKKEVGNVYGDITYEFVNNLATKDINSYKITNLDYGKKYIFGLSCYGKNGIVKYTKTNQTITVLTPTEDKSEQKLYNDRDSNKVSCKPDGSYEITNRCPNKKPINSNYTKPEYDELMEYLTRVKKYTSK
jgi:hypothetical protein